MSVNLLQSGGGSSGVAWSSITNATGNLTLSNGGFGTEIDQTSAVTIAHKNTTAATASVSQSSPIFDLSGTYWNGSASAEDAWTIQDVVANGTNGVSTLKMLHSGSPGPSGVGIVEIDGTLNLVVPNQNPFALIINNTTWGTGNAKGLSIFQDNGGLARFWNNNVESMTVNSSGAVAFPVSMSAGILQSTGTAVAQLQLKGSQDNSSGVGGVYITFNEHNYANFFACGINSTASDIGLTFGTSTSQAGAGFTQPAIISGVTGTFTKYNAEATAGIGNSYIRGVTSQKAETGADATLLSVTPAAAAGVYRLTIVMSVSAASSATLGWTATWTDSNAHAQAPTNLALSTAGTAAPALTVNAAANGVYTGEQIIDINNAGTAIVVKTTFTGTSIAYKASATIERIA